MRPLAHKFSIFGTSVFTTMTEAANKFQSVNLAQGFPNFDGPDEVKKAAADALFQNYNQYAPSIGILELREKISARYQKKYGMNFDPKSEITIFSGATEALFCSFLSLFSTGDEVIVFEPSFDCYFAGAHTSGVKLIPIQLKEPHWNFDMGLLQKSINSKTKAILLNTPHNPTGKVFSRNELQQIADIVIANDLLVITDEVYEEIIFNHEHHLLASFDQMRERVITISSSAKTFSFTGWKVGYTLASKALSEMLRGAHQYTVFCSATPLQKGLVKAFELPETYYSQLRKDYTDRQSVLFNGLKKVGFKVEPAQGSYFLVADYSSLSDLNDVDFSLFLTEKVGVTCLPMSPFYFDQTAASQKKLVRFAFCKKIELLEDAVRRLFNYFKVV